MGARDFSTDKNEHIVKEKLRHRAFIFVGGGERVGHFGGPE